MARGPFQMLSGLGPVPSGQFGEAVGGVLDPRTMASGPFVSSAG
ncbi:hypothetical protein OG711_07995 [Streptomyces uncialis]|nr:hypothetical protein [Streptomyces uncialis]